MERTELQEREEAPVFAAINRDEWYDGLDQQIATQARAASDSIRARLDRSVAEIIGAGKELAEVKASLPHGKWGDWLSMEFGMSDRTAQRFIGVAERFGDKPDTVSGLSARVLYALAAPSTSDVVVDAALGQVEAGQPVTEGDVNGLKRADAEIKAESALYTHGSGDVARRAQTTQERETAVRKAAERPDPPKPLPLICPACECAEMWVIERPGRRGGGYQLQCRDCHHRWWSSHKDAAGLPDRPALEIGKPPEPEPEPPVFVVTIRIQPSENGLNGRRCMVAIGAEGEMPQMSSTTYGQVLDVLAGLLDAHVGRAEPVGEFIEVEVQG